MKIFLDNKKGSLRHAPAAIKQVRVALLMEPLWIFDKALSRPWKSAEGLVSVAFVSHLYKALKVIQVSAGDPADDPPAQGNEMSGLLEGTGTSTSCRKPRHIFSICGSEEDWSVIMRDVSTPLEWFLHIRHLELRECCWFYDSLCWFYLGMLFNTKSI